MDLINVRHYKAQNLINFFFYRRLCPNYIDYVTNAYGVASSINLDGCHGFSTMLGKHSKHLGNLSLALPALVVTSSFGWNIPDKMVREISKA